MPRFDLIDRDPAIPVKTILHPDGVERVFDLPYDTEDPTDLELLRKHPLLVETETPGTFLPFGDTDDPAEMSVDPESEIPGTIEETQEPPTKTKPFWKGVDDR